MKHLTGHSVLLPEKIYPLLQPFTSILPTNLPHNTLSLTPGFQQMLDLVWKPFVSRLSEFLARVFKASPHTSSKQVSKQTGSGNSRQKYRTNSWCCQFLLHLVCDLDFLFQDTTSVCISLTAFELSVTYVSLSDDIRTSVLYFYTA